MDFKKLIEQNEAHDRMQADRNNDESKKLMDDFAEFVRSIDKNMIAAIGKFGRIDYLNKSEGAIRMTARCFNNSDLWNKMKISVSESTTNGEPDYIIILNGSYGIYCGNISGIEPIVAAVTFQSEYRFERTPIEWWIKTNGCPDRGGYVWFASDKIMKFTEHRMAGDNRTWLQRCKDALPQFEKEFGDYLKCRAEGGLE